MRKIKECVELTILAARKLFRYSRRTFYLIIFATILILVTLILLVQFSKKQSEVLIIPDRGSISKRYITGQSEIFDTIKFKEITTTYKEVTEVAKAATERVTERITEIDTTVREEHKTETSTSEWITFNITAYCSCTKCCGQWGVSDPEKSKTATGVKPVQGRTIAADWDCYPPGTTIEIKGLGTFTVEDKGGGIKGNKIDMYFTTHSDALKFGRQYIEGRVISE